MKHYPLSPTARAMVAFVVTVLLAVIATALLMWPEAAVRFADSMSFIPKHKDEILPPGIF